MNGYIFLNDKVKVIFSFEDNNLTLMYTTKTEIDKRVPKLEGTSFLDEIPFVIGYDFSFQKCYVFLTREKLEPSIFHSSTMPVRGYIEFNIYHSGIEGTKFIPSVSGMSFYGKELNYFYNVNRGYKFEFNQDYIVGGVETRPPSETKQSFDFNFEEESIEVNLGIETSFRYNNTTPLELKPRIQFRFAETKSIYKLIRLYHIYRSFLQFITYRKNVDVSKVILYGKTGNKDFTSIGVLHYDPDQLDIEDEKVIGKTAPYDMIKPYIKELFDEISAENLYLQHIPESKNNARIITPARFILIMAAFEWNVKQGYTITSGEKEKIVKKDLLEAIEKVAVEKGYTGKLKRKYNFFKKLLENVDVNLAGKISYVLDDLHSILFPFIESLYALNSKEPDAYETMGDRLQTQRNNYAHGNLDKTFNTDVILDIVTLEWANYAMVFKKLGYEDIEIRDLINCIFDRNMHFPRGNNEITENNNRKVIRKKRLLKRAKGRFTNRRKLSKRITKK